MSVENAVAFAKKATHDEELMKKVLAALSEDVEASIQAGIAVAKEAGFEFSKDDWSSCLEQLKSEANQDGELNDEDLEKVAGGFGPYKPGPGGFPGGPRKPF